MILFNITNVPIYIWEKHGEIINNMTKIMSSRDRGESLNSQAPSLGTAHH